jgi:hypothetical protein
MKKEKGRYSYFLPTYLPTHLPVLLYGKEKQCKWGGRERGVLGFTGPQPAFPVSSMGRKCEAPLLSHPSNPLPTPHLVATSSFLAFSGVARQHPPGLSGRRFHNKDPSSLAAFTTFLSHHIASCCCCWWLRHNRSRACLFACFVCWFVFFGFLWPAPSVSRPPPRGRAVFLYLSSNSLLSSLSLPSHLAGRVVVWFWLRALQYTRWIRSVLARGGGEAAPKIRRYVRFWTVVDILLKAVCLSSFPCPLLFPFLFGYICESCCATAAAALIAVSDHVEIISALSSEPNLLQQR